MDNSKISFRRGGFCFTFSLCFDPSGAVLPFLMLTTTKNNTVVENIKISCGHASGVRVSAFGHDGFRGWCDPSVVTLLRGWLRSLFEAGRSS